MKLLTNKRYEELLDYERKYTELVGTTFTLWNSARSRYSALLRMNKEEIVHRYFDLNQAYIELMREIKRKNIIRKEKLNNLTEYLTKHTNNGSEYLDVYEVEEVLKMLEEVNK